MVHHSLIILSKNEFLIVFKVIQSPKKIFNNCFFLMFMNFEAIARKEKCLAHNQWLNIYSRMFGAYLFISLNDEIN